jgi:hypothetical protein
VFVAWVLRGGVVGTLSRTSTLHSVLTLLLDGLLTASVALGLWAYARRPPGGEQVTHQHLHPGAGEDGVDLILHCRAQADLRVVPRLFHAP